MSDYLGQELAFYDDRIEVLEGGHQVMMSWERPLMHRMAEIATTTFGDVLEIGFGMGLSCDAVQARKPRSHTIVEAHPQIIERAQRWAAERPNATIVTGRWQDVVDELGPYDGISFDVYGGNDQRREFVANLPRLLRPRGVATLWMADDRDLAEPLRVQLENLGFTYRLTKVVAVPDKRCTYSHTNEFYLPIITRPGAWSG